MGQLVNLITLSEKRFSLGLVLRNRKNRIICGKPFAPMVNSNLQMPAEPCHKARCSGGTEMGRKRSLLSESGRPNVAPSRLARALGWE